MTAYFRASFHCSLAVDGIQKQAADEFAFAAARAAQHEFFRVIPGLGFLKMTAPSSGHHAVGQDHDRVRY
jgi:hypothetical protein